MIELLQQIEGSAPAVALRQSRWVYPLVNAGHILGLGLLVGAVLPMDWAILRRRPVPALRRAAMLGLGLAAACGVLLFIVQATDYAANAWFRAKLVLLATALANAALHLSLSARQVSLRITTACLSLLLWPSVLVCGRMVAYS